MDPYNDIVMVARRRHLQVFLVTGLVWYLASVAFGTAMYLLVFNDLRFFSLRE